jgi:transcriptional regulator with GAF, ATPase, and Fis domain
VLPQVNPLWVRIEGAEQAIRELQSGLAVPIASVQVDGPEPPSEPPLKRTFREQMDEAARQVLAGTIRQEGSISAAARALGLSRQQVVLKCKRLGLEDF